MIYRLLICYLLSTALINKAYGDGINTLAVVIDDEMCGNGNGRITGIIGPANYTYKWTNNFNITVGDKIDLIDVKAGFYTLYYTNPATGIIKIYKPPEIKNIENIINKTLPGLKNQPPGIYTLYVTGGASGACIKTYGPVTIGTTSNLLIDTSKFIKVAANCLHTGASINNINVVGGLGKVVYTWYRYNFDGPPVQVQVGSTSELRSVPAGFYYLEVTDDSGSGPVYSQVYQLRDAAEFVFYPEMVKVTKASCDAYASVTGIEEQQYLTGRLYYEWRDSSNSTVISYKGNLTNIPGGKFYLHVRSVCDKDFRFQISYDLGQDFTTFHATFRYTLRNTCVNQNTGSITIDAYPKTLQKMRWVKDDKDFALGPVLKNLGPGDYTLYVTDELGCERFYDVFTILDTTPVQILDNTGELNADTCNTSTGSIKNVQLVNGYPPFVYTWRNAAGKVVSESADALNLGAGEYTLSVSDATGCEGPSKLFTLQNVDVVPPPPPINDIYICSSGEAVFRVINPNPNSRYRLYETEGAYNPIDEQTSGEFKPRVITERKFYVSRVRGDCEGQRTEVDVKIGMIITDVTNTFTPNGDSYNDYWKINNVEKYTDALVQVFNRAGQMVFESRGYARPFDGTYNGKLLPSGVYYYVVTLDNGCRVPGNLTILR